MKKYIFFICFAYSLCCNYTFAQSEKDRAMPCFSNPDVYFEFNTSKLNLNTDNDLTLSKILAFMREFPDLFLEITGHGISDEANVLKLSKERSKTVLDYLISKGIDKNRLVLKAYGHQYPKIPPENDVRNMRVEFRVLHKKE